MAQVGSSNSPYVSWLFPNHFETFWHILFFVLWFEGTLCGHKRNFRLFSSSSYLTLHFRTDGSVGAEGFKISFGEMNQGSVPRSKNGIIELNSPCNNLKLEEGVWGCESVFFLDCRLPDRSSNYGIFLLFI